MIEIQDNSLIMATKHRRVPLGAVGATLPLVYSIREISGWRLAGLISPEGKVRLLENNKCVVGIMQSSDWGDTQPTRALSRHFSDPCVGLSHLQGGTSDVRTEIDIKLQPRPGGKRFLGLASLT